MIAGSGSNFFDGFLVNTQAKTNTAPMPSAIRIPRQDRRRRIRFTAFLLLDSGPDLSVLGGGVFRRTSSQVMKSSSNSSGFFPKESSNAASALVPSLYSLSKAEIDSFP